MNELVEFTASEVLEEYRCTRVSAVDVIDAHLQWIAEVEPTLHAFVAVTSTSAHKLAVESDQRWRRGQARPLEGVPYALKDIIATEGIATEAGSPAFAGNVPRVSATVARRLANAGAILLGKSRTYELAAAEEHETSNPWDLSRIPGVSSSGAAVAISTREVPFAIGTDTGGSIAIPASFCGVSGLKPTYGRVPRTGVFPLSWTLDHVGPMARSVEDLELVLSVIAGYDRDDPYSVDAPAIGETPGDDASLTGMRIGIPEDWFFDLCDPDAVTGVDHAIEVLGHLGAVSQRVPLPKIRLASPRAIDHVIFLAEAASIYSDQSAVCGEEFRRLLLAGECISATDYVKALRARELIKEALSEAFADVDALVVPPSPGAAPRKADGLIHVGDDTYPWLDIASRNTSIFDIAGTPALTLPAGMTNTGLPIGVLIATGAFAEASALKIGRLFQKATDHHLRRPSLIQR